MRQSPRPRSPRRVLLVALLLLAVISWLGMAAPAVPAPADAPPAAPAAPVAAPEAPAAAPAAAAPDPAAPVPPAVEQPAAAPAAPAAAPAAGGDAVVAPVTAPKAGDEPALPAAAAPMEEQPVALPGVPQPRMGARQPVDDPAVLKAAEVVRDEGRQSREGAPLGIRVVRADRQVVAGLVYYLQVELWTATRCEVHERRVYVDLQGVYTVKGDDLLPCDRTPAPALR